LLELLLQGAECLLRGSEVAGLQRRGQFVEQLADLIRSAAAAVIMVMPLLGTDSPTADPGRVAGTLAEFAGGLF
jgi:hypothetical protein